MKRKKLFGKNLTFLIVGILAVLAFIKGDAQMWCLIGVFFVFAVWTLILSSKKISVKKILDQKPCKKFFKKAKNEANDTDLKENDNDAVLIHLNCRISDYIKSVYPNATWEWVEENPEKIAAEGGTGKIRLFEIADFNYADILLDKFARINCNMLRIVSFDDLKKNGEPAPESKPAPGGNQPNQPIDPATWYSIQGKNVLEACVADLNAHGHSNLTIKENGDICVQQDNNESVCDNFKNLPGKSLWQQLIKIMENQGLAASVANDCIKVAW